MSDLIKFCLSQEDYKILDQMLLQAWGYPIKLVEEKLGFSVGKIRALFEKVKRVSRRAPSDENPQSELLLTKEEMIQIMRAVALAFIETGPSNDLSTVTGYNESEVENLYAKLDKCLLTS